MNLRCWIVCGMLMALLGMAPTAAAQTYPSQPIKIVAPFPPGGGLDLVARAMAPKLSAALGQPVVIDNRSGADGMMGSEQVARAKPDGYTLLLASTGPMVINPALEPKMPYNTQKDFAPITLVVVQPMVLVVNSTLPVKTVQEFVAYAKARPGKLNYGSGGVGNGSHLAFELFKAATGIDVLHVPYKGTGPAVIELVGGQVQAMFNSVSVFLPHIQSGKLRALGIGADQHMASLPGVPIMQEAGVARFDATSWYGLFAPAGTPREIVNRLNAESVKILRSAEMRDFLAPQGAYPVGNTVEEFREHIRVELAKWVEAVRISGAKNQ